MEELLKFENHEVLIVRKPRRRNLTIKLLPHHPVRVFANHSISQERVLEFLFEKKDWIEKCLSHFQNQYQPRTELILKPGNKFPLRGQLLPLVPVITLNKKFFFSDGGDKILVHIPRNEWAANIRESDLQFLEKMFLRFYRHLAVRELTTKILFWRNEMGLHPTKISFRLANARWGSCSSTGKISINWKLICLPQEVQEYVIVHELSHLRFMNHSQLFWSLVEKYMPERKRIQKSLTQNQFIADFLGGSKSEELRT